MYICVDLDDTLLRKDKSISEFTLETLRKCRELGHKIVINTARNFPRTLKIGEKISADYLSCNAGAQIYKLDEDKSYKLIDCTPFPKDLTDELVQKIVPFCEVISVQTEEDLYTNRVINTPNDCIPRPTSEGYFFDSYKILVYKGDPNMMNSIANKYNLSFVNYLNGSWARLSPNGATKFLGLEKVINYNKGSLLEAISFGDDYGDIEMIEKSGIGVAMDDSTITRDDNIDKSKMVFTSSADDDGVAKFLIKYFNL